MIVDYTWIITDLSSMVFSDIFEFRTSTLLALTEPYLAWLAGGRALKFLSVLQYIVQDHLPRHSENVLTRLLPVFLCAITSYSPQYCFFTFAVIDGVGLVMPHLLMIAIAAYFFSGERIQYPQPFRNQQHDWRDWPIVFFFRRYSPVFPARLHVPQEIAYLNRSLMRAFNFF